MLNGFGGYRIGVTIYGSYGLASQEAFSRGISYLESRLPESVVLNWVNPNATLSAVRDIYAYDAYTSLTLAFDTST